MNWIIDGILAELDREVLAIGLIVFATGFILGGSIVYLMMVK